jgi:hypothetical protein
MLRRALELPGLSHRIVVFWCDNYIYRLNLRNDAHDHRLGPRLVTMRNLTSPNAVREIPFRFSRRPYLKPFAEPVASLRAFKRMRKFLWATIFWGGAWHFTFMGNLAMVNLKFSSVAPHGEEPAAPVQITDAEYQNRLASHPKCTMDELPRAVRQPQFAHLIA